MNTFSHNDPWCGLNLEDSIPGKLRCMHDVMKNHMSFVTRVAVALYDPNTDNLRTFAYSSRNVSPLTHYQAKLADCHSLQDIAQNQRPRIINDLAVFNESDHMHAKIIFAAGYRSSYTLPMIWDGKLFGFVFFNSDQPNVFEERFLGELDVIAHMITLLVYNEHANVRTLLATIKSALDLTHSRDPETGCHLERMSRYARLIAKNLAEPLGFDDQFIEHIFLFSPLHDLGKLAIPDRILLKEGPLSDEEFAVMRTHSQEGRKLIDRLLENYGLKGVTHVEMLRNIALHHHEAFDGTGYPDQLQGDHIPIEARIVAVADVFDALTSKRPYKEAWSNEEAFAKMQQLSGIKFDPQCVAALLKDPDDIVDIQRAFKENQFG